MTAPTPRRHRRLLAGAGVGLALVLVAGCGDGADDEATTSTSPEQTASASATAEPSASADPSGSASPTATVPADFSTDVIASSSWPELGPRVGAGTAVRVGRHEGYDRVVYEFSGSGLPTYHVEWVDEPLGDGSGEPVEVPGDAYLEVRASTVEIPTDAQPEPTSPSAGSLEGTVVTSAEPIWGGFEGYGQTFVGVSGEQRPVRVTVLNDPTRLVVDIWR